MSVQNSAAPCGTAHFCLSETQELRLYQARHILNLVAEMADATPDAHIRINAEGLSCLMTALAGMIPDTSEMPYVTQPGERS